MPSQTAQILRRNFGTIMKRWEERARNEVSSAFGTDSLSLRDALPGHLEQLAVALESAGLKSTAQIAIDTTQRQGFGKEHGRDRANTVGYSIDEVIFEYRLLRQVIIQVLEEETPLSEVEREIITDLIEQAVNDTALEFTTTLRDMTNQFMAILTHDLRGPITAATLSAHVIIRRANNPELCVKSSIRIIDSLKRMDSMIQNLLDAGRISAGEPLNLKLDECEPTAVASEVLDELTIVHGERFVLSADPNIRTWWSCDYFRRALENLLGNAVKYGSPQTPITLSLEQTTPWVVVTVHNEGNPIPESEKAALFQRYRRAKSAESTSTRGWGLGLTLVSGVAKAHGGTVTVESSADRGTSFIMHLPQDARRVSARAA